MGAYLAARVEGLRVPRKGGLLISTVQQFPSLFIINPVWPDLRPLLWCRSPALKPLLIIDDDGTNDSTTGTET